MPLKVENNFLLDTQVIQAFEIRYLLQRLSKKIQSSHRESTNKPDLEKMIQQLSRDGFLDKILYKTKEYGNAHVVLIFRSLWSHVSL